MNLFKKMLRNPLPRLKVEIPALKRFPDYLAWRMAGNKASTINKIAYVIEDFDWSIKWDGYYVSRGVNNMGLNCKLVTSPRFFFNTLIHFGSINIFKGMAKAVSSSSNKLIATIFHGRYGINDIMDANINALINSQDKLSRVIVSTSIMRNRLISWGIPEEKISLIPLGVDLSHFRMFSAYEKRNARVRLDIPEDAVCIGSFQKDGNGWGKGLEPKWIKGPDVFVKVCAELAKQHKIHCLLTGPARGYVKNGLESAGISYTHCYLKRYPDIIEHYNCLDLYLVSSREEGGPKGIVEAMSAGVPVVSTRVGMAPDIISNGENGLMVEVDDLQGLVHNCEQILKSKTLKEKFVHSQLETVKSYDWDIICGQYSDLYGEVISERS